jgi:pyrroline-5-carboxylate reductase
VLANKSIGFIGGGNMAEALIRGLVQAIEDASQIGVSDPSEARLTELEVRYGLRTDASNLAIAEWADVVVLAVKPQVLPAVLNELRPSVSPDTLFISVAAGATTQSIAAGLGGEPRIVRSMPNTPALIQVGATVVAAGAHASESDIELSREIFDSVGITEVLAESQLDAVTGLSGSGPAYVFVMLESLADAGVKVGLPRPIALKLAAQTLMGSAKLLLDTNGHPGQLKDMVTSPGGTTIAGLHALEAGGLRTTLISAVEAATNRAKELGKKV